MAYSMQDAYAGVVPGRHIEFRTFDDEPDALDYAHRRGLDQFAFTYTRDDGRVELVWATDGASPLPF